MRMYYVERAGQDPDGPFSKKQIREDLRAGRWPYDVNVCLDGDSVYRRLEDVPQLATLIPGRSIWLNLSSASCALSGLGNFLLVIVVVIIAAKDGRVTGPELAEIAVLSLFAAAWAYIARGVYKREVAAYRRARFWVALNLVLHILYVLGGRLGGLIPIPFEIFALVTLYMARRDFNLAQDTAR